MSNLSSNQTSNVIIDGKEYDTYTEPKVLMQKERESTDFPVRELTYYFNGGKEVTEKLEGIMLDIERNPVFQNDDFYDMSKDQLREQTMTRVATLSQYVANASSEQEINQFFAAMNLLDGNTATRTGVHFGLFLKTIISSGTEQQASYWLSKGAGDLRKMFGCFSMTELGHGSNVAGLETTAVFDKKTDEFIINTPHSAATKWWIGGAAHTATHTVCYARMLVDGKDYGVKQFVVQLRSTEDFRLKQGIAVGDIGKKMGRDGVDNGWVQFTNVRVPRQFMLMKYTKVDREGNVTQPPLAQLSYAALVGGRVSMVRDSAVMSKRILTIAIRYAAIRRQFSSTPGQPETRLLDYTYHQRRLLPRLARTFAMQAATEQLTKFASEANANLEQAGKDKSKLNAAINDSKELFTLSAGLKAFCTWCTSSDIDEARQACGGSGYSAYSGIGQAFNDWSVQCTYEGDNNVLFLSSGKSLIKSGISAGKVIESGKGTIGEAVKYLLRAKELASSALNGRDITDPKVLIEAWEAAAARVIVAASKQFVELKQKGLNDEQAFEQLSQQRAEATRIHVNQYLVKAFFASIETASSSVKQVVTDLAVLHALSSIETHSSSFIVSGFLKADDLDKITQLITDYNTKIRKNAIGITDSFGLSDFFLNSAIAPYDGDTYKTYFNKVQRLNPNRPNSMAPYYHSHMKPFFQRVEEEEVDLTELEDEE